MVGEKAGCECDLPSSLATVLPYTYEFQGDISAWDVSQVTDMSWSKLCGLFVSRIVNGKKDERER
jgi:hypothetical protein